nr:hypothetical protein [Sphingomonas sp. Y57]
MSKLRIFGSLAAFAAAKGGKDGIDILFPAIAGLPAEHALDLALLPIHDANQLLLDELAAAADWPLALHACVLANDPFRTPDHLVRSLVVRRVSRICCFPTSQLNDATTNQMLDAVALGSQAEAEMEDCAREAGLEIVRIGALLNRASLF